MARYIEADGFKYYVVRNKVTGQYFRGKGVNKWGKYYNQASIYRFKKHAENAVEEESRRGNPTEVVEIRISENADVAPRAEVWIFENSPYAMLDKAFKRLFPNVKYKAFFEPNLRDDEDGNKVLGITDFAEDGEITIFIETDLSINDSVEIFAHELAHAAVGEEHGHDEVWEKAFDDLFDEYNKVGDEMFSSKINAPKAEEYTSALAELKKKYTQ